MQSLTGSIFEFLGGGKEERQESKIEAGRANDETVTEDMTALALRVIWRKLIEHDEDLNLVGQDIATRGNLALIADDDEKTRLRRAIEVCLLDAGLQLVSHLNSLPEEDGKRVVIDIAGKSPVYVAAIFHMFLWIVNCEKNGTCAMRHGLCQDCFLVQRDFMDFLEQATPFLGEIIFGGEKFTTNLHESARLVAWNIATMSTKNLRKSVVQTYGGVICGDETEETKKIEKSFKNPFTSKVQYQSRLMELYASKKPHLKNLHNCAKAQRLTIQHIWNFVKEIAKSKKENFGYEDIEEEVGELLGMLGMDTSQPHVRMTFQWWDVHNANWMDLDHWLKFWRSCSEKQRNTMLEKWALCRLTPDIHEMASQNVDSLFAEMFSCILKIKQTILLEQNGVVVEDLTEQAMQEYLKNKSHYYARTVYTNEKDAERWDASREQKHHIEIVRKMWAASTRNRKKNVARPAAPKRPKRRLRPLYKGKKKLRKKEEKD